MVGQITTDDVRTLLGGAFGVFWGAVVDMAKDQPEGNNFTFGRIGISINGKQLYFFIECRFDVSADMYELINILVSDEEGPDEFLDRLNVLKKSLANGEYIPYGETE